MSKKVIWINNHFSYLLDPKNGHGLSVAGLKGDPGVGGPGGGYPGGIGAPGGGGGRWRGIGWGGAPEGPISLGAPGPEGNVE